MGEVGWKGRKRIGVYRYPYKPAWDISTTRPKGPGIWWQRRLTLVLWRWEIVVLW